jgi:hypothetical protein
VVGYRGGNRDLLFLHLQPDSRSISDVNKHSDNEWPKKTSLKESLDITLVPTVLGEKYV